MMTYLLTNLKILLTKEGEIVLSFESVWITYFKKKIYTTPGVLLRKCAE